MSGPPLTYHQILAQHYEESARDLLVEQNENQGELEENGGIDAHNTGASVGMILPNPEDFNKFSGTRNDESVTIKPKDFVDLGKGSVRYNKDVKTDVFCVDTRFRSYAAAGIPAVPSTLNTNKNFVSPILATATSLTSYFQFHVQRMVRNVISAKLTSFELPNTFFNLVDIRNNYFFYIRAGPYDSTIPLTSVTLKASYDPSKSIYNDVNQINVDTIVGIIPGMSVIFTNGFGDIKPGVPYYILTKTMSKPSSSKSITISDTIRGTTPVFPNATPGSTSKAIASYYTQVPVFITDVNLSSTPSLELQTGAPGQNGFYYSNTSIVPAINKALRNLGITDITASYSNGYCVFNNISTNTYTLNFSPVTSQVNPQIYETLGNMLGFNNLVYQLDPVDTTPPAESPCDFQCGQISSCQCYGTLTAEDAIDMNADPSIYLALSDWDNIRHESINDSYFIAFTRIPVIVPKGQLIYDTLITSTITKKYHFLQPTNIQQFEIKLLDISGNLLLMPNTNWAMVLEMEEVLSQALYEKMREL